MLEDSTVYFRGIPQEMPEEELIPTLLMGRQRKDANDEGVCLLPWGSAHIIGRNFMVVERDGVQVNDGQGYIKFSSAEWAKRY